uniref:L-amino-acid oxidase n=1 Tax=Sphenodon punctatus TaxID=8508 RepID=A0A8D0GE08_SPHPU
LQVFQDKNRGTSIWTNILFSVIGAGIGGTSATCFLRQKFGKDVAIDVYEKGTVGGRLATINVEGKDYEAGGSVIHPLNLHMKHFVKELGMEIYINMIYVASCMLNCVISITDQYFPSDK